MATAEQVAALTATGVEIGQIQAKINELVDLQIARLETLKTTIAGIVPDAPVEPPV